MLNFMKLILYLVYFVYSFTLVLFPYQFNQDFEIEKGWSIFLDKNNYVAMINGYELDNRKEGYYNYLEIDDAVKEKFIVKIINEHFYKKVIVYIPGASKEFDKLEEAWKFLKRVYKNI